MKNVIPSKSPLRLIRLIVAIFLFSPLFAKAQQSPDDGIFAYTVWAKHSVTHQMAILFTDTVFVYNRIGIEQIMRNNDLEINGQFSTSISLETYYRINFDKHQFQDIGRDLTLIKKDWLPFTSPKMGINFGRQLYNGEGYTESDTVINRQRCKVYRFVANADSPLKDAHVTLVFSEMKHNGVHIIPNLEDAFKGRLLSMEATDDKDGRIVLIMEHIQPLSKFWKAVIDR
jgi:hypothetical protein